MQSQTTPPQNTSLSLMSSPIKWRVKTVEVKQHLSLFVTFNDGTKGEVIIDPKWLTGVFSDLNQPAVFNSVYVDHGALTWDNGLDLDPKIMYDNIINCGVYHIH